LIHHLVLFFLFFARTNGVYVNQQGEVTQPARKTNKLSVDVSQIVRVPAPDK